MMLCAHRGPRGTKAKTSLTLSQDLISNSPYFLPYYTSSYDVGSENLHWIN